MPEDINIHAEYILYESTDRNEEVTSLGRGEGQPRSQGSFSTFTKQRKDPGNEVVGINVYFCVIFQLNQL